jgi:integrase
MQWSQLDLNEAVWTIPASVAKNGRAHEVPLSMTALDIIQSLPRFVGSDLVFTTTGVSPISGFGRAKDRLDFLMETDEWRLHDLRRTVASGMARLGVAPHVIEKVLNHVSGEISGVAAVYNRHGYNTEKREALQIWSDFVSSLNDERFGQNIDATPQPTVALSSRSSRSRQREDVSAANRFPAEITVTQSSIHT